MSDATRPLPADGGGAARPLPAVHRLFPGVFYGWIVAVGGAGLSFATVGIGFYGMPILLDSLTATRGMAQTAVSGPTSLYFVVAGVSGMLVGRAVDRWGARGLIVFGATLMAACVVAIGRAREPGSLWLLYPLMAVGFAACSSVPTNSIVARWFVGLRARAMSFSHSGVSVGGMLLVPLATALVARRGLETATLALALVLLAVALPVTLFVLRFDPRDHGLAPDGGSARARAHAERNPLLRDGHQLRAWGSREALATRTFWLLAAAFGLILFCQQSVLVHQIAMLRERTGDVGVGALAVSATAAASITARLVVGGFADRVRLRGLAAALMGVQAVALVAFAEAGSVAALYAAALLFGVTIGNVYMLQSLLVGEMFGLASFGSVFGLLNLLTAVTGGLGPVSLGLVRDATGGYQDGLRALAAVACLAALLVSRVSAPAPAAPRR